MISAQPNPLTNNENVASKFIIENPDISNIELDNEITMLFMAMAPDAILTSNPTYTKYYAYKADLTVLNYTDKKITFNAERELKISDENNNYHLDSFSQNNCKMVAYHVINHPDIICLEQKDENKSLSNRSFIIENELLYSGLFSSNIEIQEFYNDADNFNLFLQKPQKLNFKKAIRNDQDLLKLIQNVAAEITNSRSPELLLKFEVGKFTVLNQKKHNIFFDICGLCINNQLISSVERRKNHYIAYNLDFLSEEIICFDKLEGTKSKIDLNNLYEEYEATDDFDYMDDMEFLNLLSDEIKQSKEEIENKSQTRFYAALQEGKWNIIFDKEHKYLQQSYDRKIMFNAFKGTYDRSSRFDGLTFPKDILQLILSFNLLLPSHRKICS